MKLLLDTHVLLWAAGQPERLPEGARELLVSSEHELLFSAASIWEVGVKSGMGREDFKIDARVLRRGLLDNGYAELAIAGEHIVAIGGLPAFHKDPFDRVLVAQAQVEGITLVTADPMVARYPGPVQLVG